MRMMLMGTDEGAEEVPLLTARFAVSSRRKHEVATMGRTMGNRTVALEEGAVVDHSPVEDSTRTEQRPSRARVADAEAGRKGSALVALARRLPSSGRSASLRSRQMFQTRKTARFGRGLFGWRTPLGD